MPTYFLSANIAPEQSATLERHLKGAVPDLVKINKLEDIAQDIAIQPDAPVYILVPGPADNGAYVDKFVEIATQQRGRFFFILISADISTGNYKRIVGTGNADWVSMAGAPQEGKYLVVYRRQQNGRYKAIVDMFSSNA